MLTMCSAFRFIADLCKIMRDSKHRTVTQTIHANLISWVCSVRQTTNVMNIPQCTQHTLYSVKFSSQYQISLKMDTACALLNENYQETSSVILSVNPKESLLEFLSRAFIKGSSERKNQQQIFLSLHISYELVLSLTGFLRNTG